MKSSKTAIDTAVRFIAVRDRTENEVRDKLIEFSFDKEEIDEAIEELYNSLLLNDEEYAKEYVRSKLAVKPISRRVLIDKLKSHKLSEENIELAMEQYDSSSEYENAFQEAKSFCLAYVNCEDDALTKRKKKDKLIRRLIAHGYPYDIVRNAVEQAYNEFVSDMFYDDNN